jgi:diguanylate cyclase (GGDEF)-like protein
MIELERNRLHKIIVLVLSLFLVAVLALVLGMSIRNSTALRDILEESVKAQLISISVAAREIIDEDKFDSYNNRENIASDGDDYARTLSALRLLQREVGAQYIYALKRIDDKYYFIFDTDTENDTLLTEYDLSPVHEQAFLGRESAGIMNVVDEWGSYNTGAVPLMKDGVVVGIISTDIEDTFIKQNALTARFNVIFLALSMIVAMSAMLLTVLLLMRRVQNMQEHLFRMANYDTITGLPNRQYLMDYLTRITSRDKSADPFMLMFIDLDNFKKVNDGAGHDAGDELLHEIAEYLDATHANSNSKSFRPSPGILNVSARIGGDEFVKIIHGVSGESEASELAQQILDNFGSQSLDRFIEKYKVGLSIGVALFPYHSTNFNVLIKYADIAMYHAKQSGKNRYCVYKDEMGVDEIRKKG